MADRLKPYRAKRSAGATPEPMGRRFVIQEHHATRLHWDLRLERDGVLVSWAIPNGLPEGPKDNRLAVHTEDHPVEYLDFHGEIPRGEYGAGTMTIWDSGTYEELKWEPRKVEVHLHGERVEGRYALFAIDKGDDPKDWMIHRMDPPADTSAEPMPDKLVPMLARPGTLPRDDENWAYEVKWDGVRAICHSEPGRMRLHSRNLLDITPRYPELGRLNRALSHHRAILDGEVVALDADGRPSFGALQRRMHVGSESAVRRLARDTPVTYMIFDLLWVDGHSLMELPYAERRARLEELDLKEGERWRVPDHVVGHGAELLAATAEQGLEGVIAKRLDSPYEPGRRSANWLKIKNFARQEVVVGGWMPGEGRRRDRIGSLLVGVGEDDGLRYAGRVGTGFTEQELDRLAGLLGPLQRDDSPFAPGVPKPPRDAVFVDPRLVAEVEFREWTDSGQLRAPSYKGLRDDKPAELVVREESGTAVAEVDGRTVRLSNLDKVMYPKAGFTKRDVIDYYARIAPVLLPHLEDRALTLKRYPNGVEGDFFYEKNAPSHRPDWVRTARVGGIDYVVVDSEATLVWLANLADLELHTSLALVTEPGRPTLVAFDLDPGAPATIVECCRVAELLHGMFEGLGLESFAKTSGSKGMQVYVPLNSEATFAQTKGFARAVAELLAREEPDLVVARQTKSARKGKVLVDWGQNDEAKTTITAYSLRAMERPTVSTPLTWDEVRAARRPEDLVFEAGDVLRRAEEHGDLFAPVLSLVQRLPGA
ncbi:MAG: bifunctional non-ous end joining protein LigD [Solirubrobacteraceae bacterium]|nr:bifunctional non-ous end joining protein LigD [Solirubrobacteraceae bacterium]